MLGTSHDHDRSVLTAFRERSELGFELIWWHVSENICVLTHLVAGSPMPTLKQQVSAADRMHLVVERRTVRGELPKFYIRRVFGVRYAAPRFDRKAASDVLPSRLGPFAPDPE